MALDVTINLADDLEAELVAQTNDHNRGFGTALSPSQFLRQSVRDQLRTAATQRTDSQKLGMRTLYKKATPTEQATIDAILNKYI